jgi:hypothetical protein
MTASEIQSNIERLRSTASLLVKNVDTCAASAQELTVRLLAEQTAILAEVALQLTIMNEDKHIVSIDSIVEVRGQGGCPICVDVAK